MKTANEILKELDECENPVTASSLKTIAISKLKKERDEAEESNESLRNQNTYLDEKLAELENELRVTDENLVHAMSGINDWGKMIAELRAETPYSSFYYERIKAIIDKWAKD